MNKWPTFQKLRHTWVPNLPQPPCRFCQAGPDTRRHFLSPCIALFHALKQQFLVPIDFIFSPLVFTKPHYLLLLQLCYVTYRQLNWEGPGLRLNIHEAKWIGLLHESSIISAATKQKVMKNQIAKLQTSRRRKLKKQRQRLEYCRCGVLRTVLQSFSVVRTSQFIPCALVAHRDESSSPESPAQAQIHGLASATCRITSCQAGPSFLCSGEAGSSSQLW